MRAASSCCAPHLGIAAERAVPRHETCTPNARLRVLGEHAAAAVFDVVGVRAESEDITYLGSGEGGTRCFPQREYEGLIAVHQ